MDDYTRSTHSSSLGSLPEPVQDAVRKTVDGQLLTLGDSPTVYVTHSVRRRKPGLLARRLGGDRDPEHWTVIVLGDRDLVVINHGQVRGTAALSCRLDAASVADGPRLPGPGAQSTDDGMSVTGFAGGLDAEGRPAIASYYVGLGPPDGEQARAALRDAIRAAKAR